MEGGEPVGERGISLIEVLVVLVIVSIMGSVIFSVGTETLENYRLDKATRLLVSDLRETREKAVAENLWHQVKFYPSTNSYRIFRQGERLEDVSFTGGISLKSGLIDISFYATGIPSEGATIILANQRGKETRVIIAPVTGRVRISP